MNSKMTLWIGRSILLICALVLCSSCGDTPCKNEKNNDSQPEKEILPKIEDIRITDITAYSASINFSVTAGNIQVQKVGVTWDTNSFSEILTDNVLEIPIKENPIVIHIDSLKPSSKYYFRVFCRTEKGDIFSQISSFNTLDVPTPPNKSYEALSMFAPFNIGLTAKTFAKDNTRESSGLYTYEEALNACPEGFRLPTKEEWVSVTSMMDGLGVVTFQEEKDDQNQKEEVSILGKIYNATADYYCPGKNVCYGIKYKSIEDGKYLTAFKWYSEDNHINIQTRYLGPSGKDINVKELEADSFWNNPSEKYETLSFPATGYYNPSSSSVEDTDNYTDFWTSTSNPKISDNVFICAASFEYDWAVDSYSKIGFKRSVRCVRK